MVCPDYRGYADSSAVPPSETGVVTDARAVYDWLVEQTGPARVIVWGHRYAIEITSLRLLFIADYGNVVCRKGIQGLQG